MPRPTTDRRSIRSTWYGVFPAESESESASHRTRQLLVECERTTPRPADVRRLATLLEEWLGTAQKRPTTVAFAVECLAWCRLHERVSAAEPHLAKELLDELTALAASPPGGLSDEPLVHQLLSAELPLTLSASFGRDLVEPARESLSGAIRELLDLDGVPHARWLPTMNGLLACWSRCEELGRSLNVELISEETRTALDGLRTHWPSFCRPNGDAMLSPIRPGKRVASPSSPAAGTHSEWGGLAVLRADASADAPRLLVDFSQPTMRTELLARQEIVWHGNWPVEIIADGQRLSAQSPWHSLCWVSDEDVDYVELQQEFTGGWKVQRQIVIGRRDQFVFAADAVVGPAAVTRIDYRSVVPLLADIEAAPAEESHESYLWGRRPLGCLVPLALPEWRSDNRLGSTDRTDAGWELRQVGSGRALYAPLFLDLHRQRTRRSEITWRQLTVGERFVSQPRDVAVGFRVLHGGEQWLFYRSLGPKTERSLLGQHVNTEFLCGRLQRDGTVKRLIEIE